MNRLRKRRDPSVGEERSNISKGDGMLPKSGGETKGNRQEEWKKGLRSKGRILEERAAKIRKVRVDRFQ